MVFFQNSLGSLLKYKLSKILIATTFALYLIVAGWLCTRVKEGLDYSTIFPTNTYGFRFVKLFYKYFTDYPQRLQVVVDSKLNFVLPEIQEKWNHGVQRFENSTYCRSPELTESWLKFFNIYMNDMRLVWIHYYHDLTDKIGFYTVLRKYFLEYEIAERFDTDIHFNKDGTDIKYSRFHIQITNTHDAASEMKMVQEVRGIADSSEFPLTVHSMWFPIYDILLGDKRVFFQFFGTATAVMIVVFFLFAPSVQCTLFVVLSFLSIHFGVVAYSSLWNVEFNIITAFCHIGCSIVPILYSLQVPFVYHKVEGKRRIEKTFYYSAMAIFQISLVILIGIFIVSFTPIPAIATFYKIALMIVLLSVLHAYFVIPTMLSFYEDMVPEARIRKRSFHRTSIRSSFRSSITSNIRASIKAEPSEDTKPMSLEDGPDIDSDEESGFSPSFSELNNEVFEFETDSIHSNDSDELQKVRRASILQKL